MEQMIQKYNHLGVDWVGYCLSSLQCSLDLQYSSICLGEVAKMSNKWLNGLKQDHIVQIACSDILALPLDVCAYKRRDYINKLWIII